MSAVTSQETNPYVIFQELMRELLTPPPAPGYNIRIDVLIGLLVYIVVMAFVLMLLTILLFRKQGRSVYLSKLVKRPQGTYLVLHQHLFVPFAVLLGSIVTIGYLVVVKRWWSTRDLGRNVSYWVCLAGFPALVLAWFITYTVLGAANLASARRSDPSKHILGPKTLNSTIGILFPLSVLSLLLCAMDTTRAFGKVEDAINFEIAKTNPLAASFTETLTPQEAIEKATSMLYIVTTEHINLMVHWMWKFEVTLISMIVSLGVLFVVNVSGAILVIRSIRVTDQSQLVCQNAPIVAPLTFLGTPIGPTPSSSPRFSDASEWITASPNTTTTGERSDRNLLRDEERCVETASQLEVWTGSSKKLEVELRGKKLDWSVTLFYMAMPPFLAMMIGLYSWVIYYTARQSYAAGTRLELSTLGVEYVGVPSVFLIVTLLVLRRAHQLYQPIREEPPITSEIWTGPRRISVDVMTQAGGENPIRIVVTRMEEVSTRPAGATEAGSEGQSGHK